MARTPRTSPEASPRAPDLILGTINGYSFYQVSAFLLTLRQTSFSGHVCLFIGPKISARTAEKLRRLQVEVVPYRETFPFIASPHPDNVPDLPRPIHLYNYRHYLYYDYLLKHSGQFRNVLITDVKDVVFQGDPFDFPMSDSLHVAMENPHIRLRDEEWIVRWVIAGYGEAVLEELSDATISCAGTTMGPESRMKDYLRAMLEEIRQMRDAYACADQAAHNLLLHRGALDPVERHANFHGRVLTVGTEPLYRLNAQRQLVNEDGSVIPIVHQYDRHQELIDLFDAKIRPTAWKRRMARLTFETVDWMRREKRKLGRRARDAVRRFKVSDERQRAS